MTSQDETPDNDLVEILMCGHEVFTELHLGVSADGPVHTLVLSGHMNAPLGGDQRILVSVQLGDDEVDAICRRLTAQRTAGMMSVPTTPQMLPRPIDIARWVGGSVLRLCRNGKVAK